MTPLLASFLGVTVDVVLVAAILVILAFGRYKLMHHEATKSF
jgi:uncharacterized membrane protein YqhA